MPPPHAWFRIVIAQEPRLRLAVVATTVKPGELLTIDYNAMEIEMDSPFDCACGSPACAGRIEGFSKLPEAVRRQYLAGGAAGVDAPGGKKKSALLTPVVRGWASANRDASSRP